MFGLTFEKVLLILVIAAFLIGPDKLPLYAEKLGALVRQLKTMAQGTKERFREEVGEEFDDIEWKKLDPRQYNPRQIIRNALAEEPEPEPEPEPVLGRADRSARAERLARAAEARAAAEAHPPAPTLKPETTLDAA